MRPLSLLSPTPLSLTSLLFAVPQHFDFVYAVPTAYFLTPFSAISLVCEGGASQALVQRMGLGKANELRPLSPLPFPPRLGC